MHFEILKDFTLRNVNFKTGEKILEADFPPQELFPWVKAGCAKQVGDYSPAPYVHPGDEPDDEEKP